MQILQVVEPMRLEEVHTQCELPHVYEVRTDRPHVWLQKVCCYILDKLGAHSGKTDTAYKVHRIDVSNIFDKILVQYEQICKYTGETPRKVLIGGENFSEMTGSPKFRHVVNFQTNATKGRYYYGDVYGIDIYVIPWMKGVVVLP